VEESGSSQGFNPTTKNSTPATPQQNTRSSLDPECEGFPEGYINHVQTLFGYDRQPGLGKCLELAQQSKKCEHTINQFGQSEIDATYDGSSGICCCK
jgi:hypothetical protein